MISYKFTNVNREIAAKIAHDIINELADKRNFDTFTLTLNIDSDESDIEVIKHPRFGCDSELNVNDEIDDVSESIPDDGNKELAVEYRRVMREEG